MLLFGSFRAATFEDPRRVEEFHYNMPQLRDTDCDTGCARYNLRYPINRFFLKIQNHLKFNKKNEVF